MELGEDILLITYLNLKLLTSTISSLVSAKDSQLCIGIDPPTSIPLDERIHFALEIIDETWDLAVAYKLNRQFFIGSTIQEMQAITERIHRHPTLAIMDHKLSDIGSSNQGALHWISKEHFDMVTISPFPGNVEETASFAKSLGLETILLTLMSNPEASYMIEGTPAPYERFAKQAQENCSGMVVGSTGHITKTHLNKIRILAPDPFVLAPGLGHQGGSVEDLKEVFGPKVIFSVSRGIVAAKNRRDAAEEFRTLSVTNST